MVEENNKNTENKKDIGDRWWIWAIGAVVLLAFLIGVSGTYRRGFEKKPGENVIIRNVPGIPGTPTRTPVLTSDLRTYVSQIVVRELGSKTNTGQNKLRGITITPNTSDRTKSDVIINLNSEDNFINNLVKNNMLTESKRILKALAPRNDIGKVVINEFIRTRDEKGRILDKKVFTLGLSKAKINNINWNTITNNNLQKIADIYVIDPLLNRR